MVFGLKVWPEMNSIRSMNACRPCEEFVNVGLQSTSQCTDQCQFLQKFVRYEVMNELLSVCHGNN
jgi:hypothetical protein